MSGTEERVADIAHVRAALADGNCPNGHTLTHGGGKWGSCDICRTTWTAGDTQGYSYRAYGPIDGYWHVTEQGKFWNFEFGERSAGFRS